jgi:pimeloyl-ACP methyl ester carboxylesterase
MSSFYHYKSESGDMADELTELMRMYPIKQYRAMIDGCVHGMLNEAVYDRLHLLKLPTLVMFGEYDALVPNKLIHPTTTKQVAMDGVKKMPNATLHMIPNCGHFLQIEKAEEVNKHIREFIDK